VYIGMKETLMGITLGKPVMRARVAKQFPCTRILYIEFSDSFANYCSIYYLKYKTVDHKPATNANKE